MPLYGGGSLHATEDAVALYHDQPEFTQLVIDLKGKDPDDAFSTIPYEKGYHFLYYLERTVGKDKFDKFIPHYFTKWSGKSLDSYEFKDTFNNFFSNLEGTDLKAQLGSIDWDAWFYKPGLPPKPDFNTTLVDACYALADKWKDVVSDMSCPLAQLRGLTVGNHSEL